MLTLKNANKILMEHELVAEEWGGNTVIVPVSAKTGEGIPQLLEMIGSGFRSSRIKNII